MTDVIEGMARAICAVDVDPDFWDAPGHTEAGRDEYRVLAQAAMDYLKQPHTTSKPTHELELARYNAQSAPEGQGPEMTQEQIAALDRFKTIWQPICDVLRGDAP